MADFGTVVPEPNLDGWRPQAPDSRDYTLLMRLPQLVGAAVPPSVAPLTTALPIADQGNIGSCTAHGSGRAFRYIDRQDGVDFDVSELYQYYNSRAVMGQQYINQDSGATIRDAVKALATYGIAKETDWPYDTSKFTQKPPQTAYNVGLLHEATEYIAVPNDVQQVQACIAAGYPVIVGFTVYENYQQGLSSGIWPEAQGKPVGGHCVLLDGYDPFGPFFPNSWGPSVGKQGYFQMSWNYLQQNGADFWIIKKVTADVTPPVPPTPPAPHTETDYEALQRILGRVNSISVGFSKSPPWVFPV